MFPKESRVHTLCLALDRSSDAVMLNEWLTDCLIDCLTALESQQDWYVEWLFDGWAGLELKMEMFIRGKSFIGIFLFKFSLFGKQNMIMSIS